MSTPRWLKKFDDWLRPVYKPIGKTLLQGILERLNVTQIVSDIVSKIIPGASNEKEIIEGLANEITDLEKENNMQEKLITELVKIMIDSGVQIDESTYNMIKEAVNG